MSTVLLCLCGCPKGDHKQGKKACGRCRVCDAFELDGEVPTSQLDVSTPPAEPDDGVEPDIVPGAELVLPSGDLVETKAALARVEQQRDEARGMWETARDAHAATLAELNGVRESLAERAAAAEDLGLTLAMRTQQLTVANAELSSARQELDQLRRASDAELQRLVPRAEQAEHDLASARQEIRQLQARLEGGLAAGRAALADLTNVLDRQQRYRCDTCGARYGLPYDDHEHGPLTPVTVLIIRDPD